MLKYVFFMVLAAGVVLAAGSKTEVRTKADKRKLIQLRAWRCFIMLIGFSENEPISIFSLFKEEARGLARRK